MPLNRFLNLPQEDRERVLHIAKSQFAAHGYDNTSLNLLLKEIELSKGQFYYWVEDKADLFFTVMQEGLDALQVRLEEHGLPKSKSEYWAHIHESRLIAEGFWEKNGFLEIGKMISQQIPANHPIFPRLLECGLPLQNHFRVGLEMGQEWGIVRTDLSVEVLLHLTEDVSDAFYKPMVHSYTSGLPPSDETLALHDLLGRTLLLILQPLSEGE